MWDYVSKIWDYVSKIWHRIYTHVTVTLWLDKKDPKAGNINRYANAEGRNLKGFHPKKKKKNKFRQ